MQKKAPPFERVRGQLTKPSLFRFVDNDCGCYQISDLGSFVWVAENEQLFLW